MHRLQAHRWLAADALTQSLPVSVQLNKDAMDFMVWLSLFTHGKSQEKLLLCIHILGLVTANTAGDAPTSRQKYP